jgi:hypothetical protein
MNRRMAERDPDMGPLMKRYSKQIDTKIRDLNITDAYLSQYGYEGIARAVASEDPAYLEERATVIADKKIAERDAAAAKAAKPAPAARTPVEGVHAGSVSAPRAPAATEEAAIRAVEVSAADVEQGRLLFGMSEDDIKRQRWEIQQQEARYGAFGIKQLGGVPICELSDIFPEMK